MPTIVDIIVEPAIQSSKFVELSFQCVKSSKLTQFKTGIVNDKILSANLHIHIMVLIVDHSNTITYSISIQNQRQLRNDRRIAKIDKWSSII